MRNSVNQKDVGQNVLLLSWHASRARDGNVYQRTLPPGRWPQPRPPHVPHEALQQTPSLSTPVTSLLQTEIGNTSGGLSRVPRKAQRPKAERRSHKCQIRNGNKRVGNNNRRSGIPASPTSTGQKVVPSRSAKDCEHLLELSRVHVCK